MDILNNFFNDTIDGINIINNSLNIPEIDTDELLDLLNLSEIENILDVDNINVVEEEEDKEKEYELTENEIDNINKNIEYIKDVYNKGDLFTDEEKKCDQRVAYRKIDYNYLLKILYGISIFLLVLFLYRIVNSNTSFKIKILKPILTSFILVPLIILYMVYKLLFPFFKVKYLESNNFDVKKVKHILNNLKNNRGNEEYFINLIDELKDIKSDKIPNSYVIKYILNDGKVNNKNLTIKEYFRYLFSKEFRIINFSLLLSVKNTFHNLRNNKYEYIRNNNQTTLWKNIFIDQIENTITKNSPMTYMKIIKIIRYNIAHIFFYNWPLLFDKYNDNNKLIHIQDLYGQIRDNYKR